MMTNEELKALREMLEGAKQESEQRRDDFESLYSWYSKGIAKRGGGLKGIFFQWFQLGYDLSEQRSRENEVNYCAFCGAETDSEYGSSTYPHEGVYCCDNCFPYERGGFDVD